MDRLLKLQGGIDEVLERQIQDEKQRWREILKRTIDVAKNLASQNLALRDHVETLDSDSPRNLLATLKLVSFYNTVISRHLRNVRENAGSVSYLLHDIRNEIFSLLTNAARDTIMNETNEAKYFGILLDSTHNISHTEQLAEVIRYVHFDLETGNATVKETFIKCVELDKKNAAGYEEIIPRSLEVDGFNFRDCRAQIYDKSAVMSGAISGVQTRLRETNLKAVFINYDNHTLNLAGTHASSPDPTLVTFFGTIYEVYVSLSAFTTR
ncbi:hypothetical protein ACJMK2_038719 [Sinanodonta woodiana]|uniref:DUF4371 domain-containing protein n=1 Tax=Sinanodonta woodiana TaxID=1069815 RepID=A0ABD3W9X0_SINWO